MPSHEDKYLDLAAARALGALEGEELREFESHCAGGCEICEAENGWLERTAGMLPLALPALEPPDDLRETIVARVHASSRARNLVLDRTQRAIAEPRPQGGRPWMTLALGVGLMLVVIAFTVSYQTLVRQIRDRDQTIASQTTEITQLQDEVQREAEILKVLQSRRIDVVAMNGLEVNPVGYGKIIWDPDRKVAILQVANLPAVPAGKDYQLWIIKNKDPHPVSAGVFAVANDREAQNYFKVQPLQIVDRSQITAFAVTLEPKGGMPQPTGAMYLMGKTAAD